MARQVGRFWKAGVATSALAFALSLAGCGGDSSSPSSTTTPKSAPKPPAATSNDAGATAAAEAPKPADTAKPAASTKPAATGGIGTLTGVIKLEGTAPDLAALVTKGDSTAKDAEVCAAEDIPNESVLVGEEGGLRNVFIYLGKAPKDAEFGEAEGEPTVDQKGCRFEPHCLVVRAGQPIRLLNSDAIPHNVHTFPTRNSALNTTIQSNDAKGIQLTYAKMEQLPVRVVCDIHPWMVAYQLPMDHPYIALTDANGRFEIPNLPAGKHSFRIWHEKAGMLSKEYEIEVQGGDEPTAVEITFPASSFAQMNGPAPKTIVLSASN